MPGIDLGLGIAGGRVLSDGFDFTGGVLPGGAGLARGSAAWFQDAAGNWQPAAADVARFGWRWASGGWVPGGLMVESAATNLAANSAATSQSGWGVNGAGGVAVANGQAGPFGADGARVTANGAASAHFHASPSVNVTPGVQYCGSRFVKPLNGLARLQLTAGDLFGYAYANFSFAGAGAVVGLSSLAAGAGIEPAGDGWWRIWLAGTAGGSGSGTGGPVVALIGADGDTRLPVTAGTGAFLTMQSQVEAGVRPSSPIVTGAGAGTRAGDVLTLDWASRGLGDGMVPVRCGYDDGAALDVVASVSGGRAVLPAAAGHALLRSVRRI